MFCCIINLRKVLPAGGIVMAAVLLLVGVLFGPPPVFAAELFFGATEQTVAVGQSFEVGLFVNTDNELVNALEGTITLPADLVRLEEVRDGGSIISLWIHGHKLEDNSFGFAGVIPGGYAGQDGYIASLILTAKKTGRFTLSTGSERILLHDGQGTATQVRRAPLSLQIEKRDTVPQLLLPKDTDPPEPFVPVISTDPELFEGMAFLVFATTDKESGIKEYRISESPKPYPPARLTNDSDEDILWKPVQSPYPLSEEAQQQYIYIKAVDNAGNARIAVVSPEKGDLWQVLLLVLGTLGLLLAGIFIPSSGHRSRRTPKS